MRTDFMSGKEVVAEMRSGSTLAKLHAIVAEASAQIVTGSQNRNGLSIIEIRNIEFDAAIKIAGALGIELKPCDPPK